MTRTTDPIDAQLEEFLRTLEHPLKPQLLALRKLILEADPAIREGFKWNSPSFRTREWFATINLSGAGRAPRPNDPPALRLVLHTGARARASAKKGLKIADPAQLLEWPAKDRCIVSITSSRDLREKRAALQSILREWIGQL